MVKQSLTLRLAEMLEMQSAVLSLEGLAIEATTLSIEAKHLKLLAQVDK